MYKLLTTQRLHTLIPSKWTLAILLYILTIMALWPEKLVPTLLFIVNGLVAVAPLVIPGILVSAWVNASGAGGRIKNIFEGQRTKTVLMAAAIGAISPVCGITVLPLMVGLLSSGVPLAPVMAFWLSSPVTDPAMFTLTIATLGMSFALFKTIAAFVIGFFGGMVTACLAGNSWIESPLRQKGIAGILGKSCCEPTLTFDSAVWKSADRRQRFYRQTKATTHLMLICLSLAFSAEFLMQEFMQPEALAVYVGKDSWWAIPLAVFVGSPAYVDGYAALPLTRGLIDHGMSPGAAMAFLVSGSVVSIWGAMAIFPALKIKPFLLYLVLAVISSLIVGWVYEIVN